MNHIFSDDPDNPLNKEIINLIRLVEGSLSRFDEVKEIAHRIYSLGFEDGQGYVWSVRSIGASEPVESTMTVTDNSETLTIDMSDKDGDDAGD